MNTLPYSSFVPLYGVSTRKNKFNYRYDLAHRAAIPNSHHYPQEYDLRLIAIRHGERVDTARGDNWYKEIFHDLPRAPEKLYHHPYLPSKLPRRDPTFHYLLDPPIIKQAEMAAMRKGQSLMQRYKRIDQCYSSPAARCVLTADALLRGMNRNSVPIRIEPYIFEPMEFNTALLAYSGIPPCMNRSDWQNARHIIDRAYNPISRYLKTDEKLLDYYNRTADFFYQNIDHLPSNHPTGNNYGSRSREPYTVLIVGHAATPIIFSEITSNNSYFNEEKFKKDCEKVNFLNEVVLYRNRATRQWSRQRF